LLSQRRGDSTTVKSQSIWLGSLEDSVSVDFFTGLVAIQHSNDDIGVLDQ